MTNFVDNTPLTAEELNNAFAQSAAVNQQTVTNITAAYLQAPGPIGNATPNTLNGIVTATGSTTGRTLATRFAEVVNVLDRGAVGDGVTDDTAALQAAFNTGQPVRLPTPSGGFYRITGLLQITTPEQQIFGDGPLSVIKFVGTGATIDVQPALVVMQAAVGAVLTNFTVDHNSSGFTSPAVFLSTLGAGMGDARGVAVLVMADDAEVRINVRNGWDDGLGFGNYAIFTTGNQSSGPDRARAVACKTSNCGSGLHTWGPAPNGVYQQGAGIDALTATNFTATACTDDGSFGGFWFDDNGGAYGEYVGCVSTGCQLSPAWGATTTNAAITFQPTGSEGWLATPGGISFYSGTYGGKFTSCTSINSGGYGMVLNTYSSGNQVTGFRCVGAGLNGFIDAGVNNSFSGMSLEGCGSAAGTTAPSGSVAPGTTAFSTRGSAGFAGTGLTQGTNLNVAGTPVYPGGSSVVKHTYAVEAVPLTVGSTTAYRNTHVLNANLVAGTSGTYNIGTSCDLSTINADTTSWTLTWNGSTVMYAYSGQVNIGVPLVTQITYQAVTTVAQLPTAGTAGRRSYVSDATSTTFGATATGGGSNKMPVFDDGTAWLIG